MLTLVRDPKQVKKLYTEFRALLDSNTIFPEHRPDFTIGHRGGTAATDANFSPKLNIWTSPDHLQWNAFGVGKSPSMVVQINFQDYSHRPRRVGAVFALDEENSPIVLHRGHIGGGKAGVGRGLMLNECRSEKVWLLEDDGQQTECFVVGELRSKFFGQQLATFVQEVQRVKEAGANAGLTGIASSLLQIDNRIFAQEKSNATTRSSAGSMDFTHGLVVNELAQRLGSLAASRGWTVHNDRHRDLMLMEGRDLQVLFEVKTSVTTQTICTGLGQLLLYSSAARTAKLVLVLPEKLPAEIAEQLKKWQVQVLCYNWVGTTPRFSQLSRVLG
jgi:hypothetical protein